jgi:hypothetical protein
MLRELWALASAAITGRYMEHEIDAGFGLRLLMLFGCAVAIPMVIVFYPLLAMFMWVSWVAAYLQGADVRVTADGLAVFSRIGGNIASYAWADIRELRHYNRPPIVYPAVVLADGQVVHLESADSKVLTSTFESRGLRVDPEARFANEA